VCASRDMLLQSLQRDYSEAPSAIGVANDGNVLELFKTQDGKTWTLLMSMPDGTSCVVAAGEGWESLPQQVAGSDA
ncbi:MAG: hypothetical protein K2X81_04540, partial [Candidatus Obscuribacterales bacterium]|nr:hypothetical protein [Candidatus Obscuribacterales bacterium]